MPRLSIIVPVYNVENYLSEAIDSILAQTFSNYELLLIDDGSSDRSGVICDEYGQKDYRIKVFHQENQGVSVARNIGLDNAIGDFVTFLDPDDFLIDLDLYSKIFQNKNDGIDLFYFGYKRNKAEYNYSPPFDGIVDHNLLTEQLFPSFVGNDDNSFFLKFHTTSVWTMIVKRELIGSTRFHQIKRTEDKLFFFEIVLRAKKMYFLTDQAYFYRINLDSTTTSYNPDFLTDMIFSINCQNKIFKNYYDDNHMVYDRLFNFKLRQFYSLFINEVFSDHKIDISVSNMKKFNEEFSILADLKWSKVLIFTLKNPFWLFLKLELYAKSIKLYRFCRLIFNNKTLK